MPLAISKYGESTSSQMDTRTFSHRAKSLLQTAVWEAAQRQSYYYRNSGEDGAHSEQSGDEAL
jgi:hypothetical protein